MNHTEIRFLVRSKTSKPRYYRKGLHQYGGGWYDSPFDATLFDKKSIKYADRLCHGLHPSKVEVVEVDVTVTDEFPSERKVNE